MSSVTSNRKSILSTEIVRLTTRNMEKNQDTISAQLMKWEKFTVEEKPIGEGSFGEIYKGKWAEQNVVLKKLKGTHLSTDVIIGEINTLARLHNKHIVLALGATMDPKGDLYLVMEYSKNGSLYTALHKSHLNLRLDEVLQLGLDVAKGLAYLHANDPIVIHRDIKSDNILLFSDRTRAKISDFGTAKLLGEEKFARTYTGTFGYMAPEIHDNKQYNEKIDVYALGVLLFEMVCKQSLAMTWELRRDKITSNVKDEGLRNLILNCCKHNPNDRPTMNQVVVILRQMLKASVQPLSSNSALSRLQRQVAALCFQGQDKLKKQDYKGAIDDFNKADEIQPNNATTLAYRGVAKMKLNDMEGAIDDLSGANDLQPNNLFTLRNRAAAYLFIGKFAYSLQDIITAVENNPTDEECLDTYKQMKMTMIASVQQGTKLPQNAFAKLQTGCLVPYSELEEIVEIKVDLYRTCKAKWHGRTVAVKEARNTDMSGLFAEATMLATLHHESIVSLLGVTANPKTQCPALILEYMEYGSLETLNKNQAAPYPLSEVIQIALDVANGLKYLHSQHPQIIHCSVSGSHILINKEKRAKLTGFTTARIGHHDTMVLPITAKIDVRDFGVVLYEMAKEPTKLEDDLSPFLQDEYLKKAIQSQIKDKKLQELILNCCKRDPKRRLTMNQVVQELEKMRKSQTI